MIFVLRPGDKATTINPNFPVPDLKVLQEILARRIGAALGISWRVVLSDLGEANFSAARADRIEFEESASIPRMLLVAGLDWMRRLALEDALLRGCPRLVEAGVTVEDLAKVTWLRRAKEWLDPKAEADGDIAALEGKLITRRDYHAKRGQDWKAELIEQLDEEVFEREQRALRGLPAPAADALDPASAPQPTVPTVGSKKAPAAPAPATTPRPAVKRALAEIEGQRGEADDGIVTREFKVKVRAIDEETREIEYVGATETPVDFGDGIPEVLRMDGAEFEQSVPFLDCHKRQTVMNVLGRSVAIKREGRELVFRVRYSKATDVSRAAWDLVKDGSVDRVSVGYSVRQYRELRRGEFDGEGAGRVEGPAVIATKWRVRELSQVPIGADPNARKRAYAGAISEEEAMKIKPNPGETREQFTARAMLDAGLLAEFPDETKRREAADGIWAAANPPAPVAPPAPAAPAPIAPAAPVPATPPAPAARSIDDELAADLESKKRLILTRCPQDLRGFLDGLLLDQPMISPEDAWAKLREERASRFKSGGTPEPRRTGTPPASPAPTPLRPPSPPSGTTSAGSSVR
jgi:hypothetical protein